MFSLNKILFNVSLLLYRQLELHVKSSIGTLCHLLPMSRHWLVKCDTITFAQFKAAGIAMVLISTPADQLLLEWSLITCSLKGKKLVKHFLKKLYILTSTQISAHYSFCWDTDDEQAPAQDSDLWKFMNGMCYVQLINKIIHLKSFRILTLIFYSYCRYFL